MTEEQKKVLALINMMNNLGINFALPPTHFEKYIDGDFKETSIRVLDSWGDLIGFITKELFDKLGNE